MIFGNIENTEEFPYLEEQVKLAFDEANVTIPYPRLDVRVTK